MTLVRPAIEASLYVKDHAVKAIREKWPEDIADRLAFLLDNAVNVLYVAARPKDYFEVPQTEIDVNVWIESFSLVNAGRFAGLATTDPELFNLLYKHRKINKGTKGLLFIPVVEVTASGGKRPDGEQRYYTSFAASNVMVLSPYPLPRGLTRCIPCGTIEPTPAGVNDRMAEICIKLFMTVNYHLSMKWPTWVAEHPSGPVFVFGFNPVLDVHCSANAYLDARRSQL